MPNGIMQSNTSSFDSIVNTSSFLNKILYHFWLSHISGKTQSVIISIFFVTRRITTSSKSFFITVKFSSRIASNNAAVSIFLFDFPFNLNSFLDRLFLLYFINSFMKLLLFLFEDHWFLNKI
ncbi:hypothetical protein LEP1GSC088_2003 [Leptospira interrogans str. L1207]|nr:hypothetical protein LEP1GSC088_2003 [Leptospira interrogans str. L1207]